MNAIQVYHAKNAMQERGATLFYQFTTLQEARDFRHDFGTGGWVFAPETGGAILFPPHMTPTAIFHHPMAKGQSGRLIGSM